MQNSWDIQPRKDAPVRKVAQKQASRVVDMQVRATAPARHATAKAVSAPVRPKTQHSGSGHKERTPLKQRRRAERQRLLLLAIGALVLLIAGTEFLLWQPFLRVQTIKAEGIDSEQIQSFVEQSIQGSRFFLVPRNSIFFIPERQLRTAILLQFPQAEAVSITPVGLTTLTVSTTERATVFWWCGESVHQPQATCYQGDVQGVLFKEVPPEQRYATGTSITLYSPRSVDAQASSSPLGTSIVSPALLPPLLEFVKTIRSLGANVVSVDIRGDEADLYTQAGTRITYVRGREERSARLAATAFPSLNLNDGSLQYVDVRFDSKVFFKKKEGVK